jgi:hypothetical protein
LTNALIRKKGTPVSEYLPQRALMTLWTSAHLGVSPASETIRALDEWQIGLIYETVMNFPVDGLRRSYFDRKDKEAVENIDDDSLLEIGYSPEEIAGIKGKSE